MECPCAQSLAVRFQAAHPSRDAKASVVHRCLVIVGMLSLIGWASDASAQEAGFGLSEEPPVPLIDALFDFQAQLESLQQQIDSLKSVQPQPLICCPPEKQDPKFPTARLTGFFQADAVWFDQSLANQIAVGNGVAEDGDA